MAFTTLFIYYYYNNIISSFKQIFCNKIVTKNIILFLILILMKNDSSYLIYRISINNRHIMFLFTVFIEFFFLIAFTSVRL